MPSPECPKTTGGGSRGSCQETQRGAPDRRFAQGKVSNGGVAHWLVALFSIPVGVRISLHRFAKSYSAEARAESSIDGLEFDEGFEPNNGPEDDVEEGSWEPIGNVGASIKGSRVTGPRVGVDRRDLRTDQKAVRVPVCRQMQRNSPLLVEERRRRQPCRAGCEYKWPGAGRVRLRGAGGSTTSSMTKTSGEGGTGAQAETTGGL